MEQLIPMLGNWVWFVAAGILLLLELLSPGVFFIWLGIAAALTGIADNIQNLPWQGELALFAVLSVLSVVVGRRFYHGPAMVPADNPHLNRRHTIFGEVVDPDSQKVVDAIATTATDRNDRPADDVVIESITIS